MCLWPGCKPKDEPRYFSHVAAWDGRRYRSKAGGSPMQRRDFLKNLTALAAFRPDPMLERIVEADNTPHHLTGPELVARLQHFSPRKGGGN